MWPGKSKRKDIKIVKGGSIDTLITGICQINGDIQFNGVLFFDGTIKGNIRADDAKALLTIGPNGRIEGDVSVPNIVIHGKVIGEVHARAHVSMSAEACVDGNLYYNLIEMTMGAHVNGKLVHQPSEPKALEHKPDSPVETQQA